jgi:hypothetical protein
MESHLFKYISREQPSGDYQHDRGTSELVCRSPSGCRGTERADPLSNATSVFSAADRAGPAELDADPWSR